MPATNLQLTTRPIGPRSPPTPQPLHLEPTLPLNIRKVSKEPPPSLILPAISPARPTTPRPSKGALKLSISAAQTVSPPSYYGGDESDKTPLNVNTEGSPDDVTIRPGLSGAPSVAQKTHEQVDELSRMVEELNLSAASAAMILSGEAAPSEYSDGVLEELTRLGEGAGGAVHKMKDKRTGKVMARKTITTREAPMKQILRELSIISSTQHRNVTLFYGAYISPSSSEVKIVMEYCEGGSLETIGKRIKERRAVVAEKIAGRLAEGVLQGLNYLHSKRTIHRDIKPSNILLSREGVVKLCDFGVSGELVDSVAGTFTGTSFYMAPERILGHPYTITSDVWSTGISLLELVQNRHPFPSELSYVELMMYIAQGEPPSLEDEPPAVWSDTMKDFIKLALNPDAQKRPYPRELLSHPWIVGIMAQEIHMARWIRQIWDWPKPPSTRKSKDTAPASRPSSSHQNSTDSASSVSDPASDGRPKVNG